MTEKFQQVQILHITEDNQFQRIDNFLVTKLKGVPKSKVYRILRKGEVRVNKKRIKPDYKLQIDDQVRVPPIRLESNDAKKLPSNKVVELLNDSILYEDDRLIVLNKPSGIAVHGGSGLNYGVIEGLRASRKQHEFLELVHRLDRDTSGCLLIAKKRSALRSLHQQLRDNQVNKIYHALVRGYWPKTTQKVDAPLFKNTLQGGERMVQVNPEGKTSLTLYKVLRAHERMSLVECKPITGRTHQIRVHCLHAGHPIANDSKYGDKHFDLIVKDLDCNRLFLHAYQISFIHPHTEEKVTFTAPYDKQLKNVVTKWM
ncbi:23S rRNA pseudouridine(955/2504/2580) synthase RluC [Agaribacter marinus]|uniref:Pseudouridine synthase n=1 Tax=Agaribacter marinus TaxID=1431249 RepID=A0AA37WHS9_9ALTE|nr:23S rRNA pseudouridine(955/2504/2580) synthase RluC [Agaribacter marinus]GLR70142.1 pseudouridine synthase [Agaribacter marinus]